MSYRNEITAYFELDSNVRTSYFNEFNQCVNKECKQHGFTCSDKNKFCHECGSKMEMVKGDKQYYSYPSPLDFEQNYLDQRNILRPSAHFDNIWDINHSVDGTTHFSSTPRAMRMIVLSDIDFSAEIKLYEADPVIKKIKEKIEEVYGPGSVELKIGFFTNYA